MIDQMTAHELREYRVKVEAEIRLAEICALICGASTVACGLISLLLFLHEKNTASAILAGSTFLFGISSYLLGWAVENLSAVRTAVINRLVSLGSFR